MADSRTGARVIWGLVALLAVLHYDFWYWDDRTLVLGILPIGLAYHALFSLTAGCLWALAIKFAWPAHLEAWAAEAESADGDSAGGPFGVDGAAQRNDP